MSNDVFSQLTGLQSIRKGLKAAADEWKYVDAFTVRQVAFLWGGYEPIEGYFDEGLQPQQYGAIRQTLLSRIESGTLPARKVYSMLPADDSTTVQRRDLQALCEALQVYPAFLFDTIPATNPDAVIEEADESLTEGPSYADKTGGRPPQYNWDKIVAAAMIVEDEEGLPEGLLEKCRKVREFIEKGYSFKSGSKPQRAPDLSTIQRRLKGLFDAFDDLRAKVNAEKKR